MQRICNTFETKALGWALKIGELVPSNSTIFVFIFHEKVYRNIITEAWLIQG